MGQKVNPHGARVGVIYNWSTRWYAGKKDFANNLVEDYKLREMLKEKYYSTGISHIDIERSANRVTINIFTAKPGMIIGRGGAGIEALKKDVEAFLGSPANINIMEIKVPDTNAQLVAENIAQQLEKRISWPEDPQAQEIFQQDDCEARGQVSPCIQGRRKPLNESFREKGTLCQRSVDEAHRRNEQLRQEVCAQDLVSVQHHLPGFRRTYHRCA